MWATYEIQRNARLAALACWRCARSHRCVWAPNYDGTGPREVVNVAASLELDLCTLATRFARCTREESNQTPKVSEGTRPSSAGENRDKPRSTGLQLVTDNYMPNVLWNCWHWLLVCLKLPILYPISISNLVLIKKSRLLICIPIPEKVGKYAIKHPCVLHIFPCPVERLVRPR